MDLFGEWNFGNIVYTQLTTVVWVLVGLALVFDFLNGMNDAANSIATVVSTRVLAPGLAVIWAAFFNFIAFLIFSLKVARTIGTGIIDPTIVTNEVIAATLVGACVWVYFCTYLGLPISVSHSLIGGMVGSAVLVAGIDSLQWNGISMTLVFIVLSPLVGAIFGLTMAVGVTWLFRRSTPRNVDGLFRRGQLVSAAFYSLGHGGNDAQKTMGIIFVLLLAQGLIAHPVDVTVTRADVRTFEVTVLAPDRPEAVKACLEKDVAKELEGAGLKLRRVELPASPSALDEQGRQPVRAQLTGSLGSRTREELERQIHGRLYACLAPIPTEVVLACHLMIALGTLAGGWAVIHTLGHRIIKLRPIDGFCAETGAAGTLVLTIIGGVPVSTTHTITGSILGVGSARYRLNAVRWGVAGQVVWAWVFTIPGAAIGAALTLTVLNWLG